MDAIILRHQRTETGAVLSWALEGWKQPLAEIYETATGVYLTLVLRAGWYNYTRKVFKAKSAAKRYAEKEIRIETPLMNMNYKGVEIVEK